MNAVTTIDIALDGAARGITAGTTLAGLVAELGHRPHEVATAVNGRFIARGQREELLLKGGDSVLFFQPISGG